MGATKRQAKGEKDQMVGSAKKAVGKSTRNRDLQAKGQMQQTKGKVRSGIAKTQKRAARAMRSA
jgi:uncharacterized protein YjbJ (UPF0337 family)